MGDCRSGASEDAGGRVSFERAPEPRYYVRYQCRKDGPQLPATHLAFVRDSWYCHWDIARFEQTGGATAPGTFVRWSCGRLRRCAHSSTLTMMPC